MSKFGFYALKLPRKTTFGIEIGNISFLELFENAKKGAQMTRVRKKKVAFVPLPFSHLFDLLLSFSPFLPLNIFFFLLTLSSIRNNEFQRKKFLVDGLLVALARYLGK